MNAAVDAEPKKVIAMRKDTKRSKTNNPEGIERLAFTVDEFCQAFRMSRASLYNAWLAGTGPKFKTIGVKGAKRIIPVEAAREWVNATSDQTIAA
jgi:hypothetical protein